MRRHLRSLLLSAGFILACLQGIAISSILEPIDGTWLTLNAQELAKRIPPVTLQRERLRARDGRFRYPVVRDAVPEGIRCNVTERCDRHNVCVRVCTRGTVAIDPWLRSAVDYQWRLSRRQPLCFAQWMGTHNSAITLADGYGMHDDLYTQYLHYLGLASGTQRLLTNNQVLSLTDQLNLGVRFLELDVHWIQMINALARLFGHPPVEWDAETLGCDPSLSSLPVKDQRAFTDALSEVAAWLTSPTNQDEFLVLYLDNQLDLQAWGRVGPLLGQVVAAISPVLTLTPSELNNITQQRGSMPSVDELIHVYGKRLILMSGSDYGEEMSWLAFSHHSLCNLDEPLFRGFRGPPECHFHNWHLNLDTPVMSGRMFRTPTCNLMYGPYNCSMLRGINTPQLDAEQLPGATSCGINVPAPDQLTPQLVQSYIWSWAEGHMPLRMAEAAEAQRGHPYASTAAAALTADGEGSCVVLRSRDGRWEVRPSCNGASFAACRRNAGPQHVPGADAWALGPLETAIGATAPCPQGYLQSAPHTARENWELWQLLKRQQHNLIQQQSIQQQSRWAQLNDPTEWGLDSTLGGAHGKISPSGRGAKKTYQAVTGIIARDRHLCTHCGTGDKPSRYDAGRGSFPSGDGHGRMRSTLELVRPQRGALREKSSSEAFQPQVTTPLQGREAGPGLVTEAEVEVEMIPVAAGGNAPLSSDYQQSEQQRQRQPQHMGSGVLGGIPIGDVEVEVLVVLTLDRVSWLPVDLV